MSEARLAADRTTIQIERLRLPNGLVIDSIDVTATGLRVNVVPFELPAGSCATVVGKISYEGIARFLNESQPGGMSGFEVRRLDGELAVTAFTKLLIPVQVGALGKVSLVNREVRFEPSRVEVAGVKAPEALANEQLNRVNPLIDLTTMPFEVSDFVCELHEDALQVTATVTTNLQK